MFKVKKKDTRETSTNYMFMSINVVLVSFFVNLDVFTPFSSVFILNFEQVNTNWQ